MAVRKAKIKDAQEILELQIDTILRYNNRRDYSNKQIYERIDSRRIDDLNYLTENGFTYVCVAGNGKIVGFETSKKDQILQLFVSADHQGKGVGSLLLTRMEGEWAEVEYIAL